ncbi:glycosyltransferase [uncultured Tessaracoccus sp.]|uniref:glycosyltransferase n=1 Tax=uncultured Tessaracoccus sp. TaxID=905023 RepID=UPI0026052C80|nr:glycosyltransferase [uncultured Tessaracoccus sp.]
MSEADDGQRFKDLWAWADEDDEEFVPDPVHPDDVVAVMVVRDAASWLAEQLDALGAMTQRPGTVVAVDVASTDESAELLRAAVGEGVIDKVVSVERECSFPEAVAAGIDGEPAWIWVLHDDSAPDPTALAELLMIAPTADLMFPKLIEPRRRNYPDIIAECGQTMTKGGRRVGIPEEGDVDQRQLEPGATLGGSTAGMLVRGELWRELGGLAPELPGHRDGVDLGWRANIAGWRVATAPTATLVHRQASMAGERPVAHHPHFDDRLAALRIASVHGAGSTRLLLSSWCRAVGFLLAKSPGHARAELRAHRRFAATRDVTRALRERVPEGDASAVEDLLPAKSWGLRKAFDSVGSAVAGRYRDFTSDTSLDELTSDEFGAHDAAQRPPIAPGVLLVFAFLLVGIGASWRLWGGVDIAGGGMLPAPASLTAAWQAFLHDANPSLGLGALMSTLLGGQPWLANFIAVLLAPPFAALAVNSLGRQLGVRPSLAAAAAVVWGAAALVLGLPSGGDVSGLVAATVGPLVVKQAHRVILDRSGGAERLRAPAIGAFWLFVLAAFWPPALVLATIAVVVGFGLGRVRGVPGATFVVPVWLLFLPWLGHLVRYPGRVFTGIDPLAWPDFPPAGWALLAGRLMPAGIPVWLSVGFFVGLALLAMWGLLRIPETARRWGVVGLIVAPLVVGVGLSRLALTVDGGQARALLSPWALLTVAGMIAAMVLAERPRVAEYPRAFAVVGSGLLAAVVLGAWPIVGMQGPVSAEGGALPGYVRNVLASPRDSRALLIEKSGDELAWNVADSSHPQWGSAERTPGGELGGQFEQLVQAFAGSQVPDDLAQRLQHVAVSHVWLRGFSADELLALGNAEGLTSAPSGDATVFTVTGLVSRAAIVEGQARVPVVEGKIPSGDASRRLVIADPDVVEVRVADTRLKRVDGELPTFELGELRGALEYSTGRRLIAVGWMAFVLLGLGLLAVPTMQPRAGARRAGGDE